MQQTPSHPASGVPQGEGVPGTSKPAGERRKRQIFSKKETFRLLRDPNGSAGVTSLGGMEAPADSPTHPSDHPTPPPLFPLGGGS